MTVTILSLFDGMACGYIAFKELGIPIGKYYAYEIDKYAVQTSSHNFPDIVHKGNVFNADFSQYKNIDWLIGGSPCTYWSIAQKSSTRETEASGIGWELFSQYVKALKQASPKYFIYENNKSMANQIKESISATFGFEPVCINSALVSAQNRQRLYWVGIRQTDGTYIKADIEQPEDRKIFLKDILDGMTDREKGRCIISSTGRTTVREYFYKSQGNMALEPVAPVCVAERGRYTTGGEIKQNYEVRIDGKTNTLTTVQKDNNVCEPVRVGSLPRPNGELSTSQAFRIYGVSSKSTTLSANGGGAGAKTGLYAIPVEYKGEEPTKAISNTTGQTYTVYKVINGEITIKGRKYPIKLKDGYYIIRKLTVNECKRLQTVPEWYEFPVSDTQAYKMLGNGWTVNVIKHLIKAVRKEN